MYKYLRRVLAIAESIGEPNRLHMGDWTPGDEYICVTGVSYDGKNYELRLTMEKEAKTDGN